MDKEYAYSLIKEIALDCIQYYKKNRKKINSDTFTNYYDSYPLLRHTNVGFPYFTKSNNFKKNYSNIFIKDVGFTNRTSFTDYLTYILNDEEYCKFYNLGKFNLYQKSRTSEATEWLFSKMYVLNIIDRYFQLHSKLKLQEVAFRNICFEWLNIITKNVLKFNLVIPILMNTFSFNKIQLSEDVEIFKMNDQFQKSRHNYISDNSSANERVVACATHAIRIKNNTVIKDDENSIIFLYKNKELIQLTDLLFGFLRFGTNCVTGYAQLIIQPVGWAQNWIADLDPLIINTTRAYPTIFEENRLWYRKPDIISRNQLFKLNLDNYLDIVSKNRGLKISIQRLNSIYIRQGEADIILDIAIALEAIYLEVNDNEGITYKLASRTALLCKYYPLDNFKSEDIYKATKKMYAFRSAIVHSKGEKEVNKTKMIKLTDSKEINAIHYGINLLTHTIKTMVQNPEFLVPENIDALMHK